MDLSSKELRQGHERRAAGEHCRGTDLSCADLMHDFLGCVDSGIDDLATNPAHLEAAIVEDWERSRQ